MQKSKNIKEGDILNGLIKKRREAGLTQSELAEKINVSQSTVSMWETKKANPMVFKLPVIAKVLGCSIDDLFNDTGNRE